MKINKFTRIIPIFAIFATIATTTFATPTRREIRLEERIKTLSSQIQDYEQALVAERASRGIFPIDLNAVAKRHQDSLAQIARAAEALQREMMERPDPVIEFNPAQIDSLIDEWFKRGTLNSYDEYFNKYISLEEQPKPSKDELDSIYKMRLRSLASPIELPYNQIVRTYINRYTDSKSNLMSHITSRAEYFFPIIEEELIRQGLPIELRSMAVVESVLTTTAVSQTGAGGLWQFMPATGKIYGLEINSLVDERCDPIRSTIAACQFMSDLYKMFGDWSLALAAYNCGPGNVNKALARSKLKSGSYWDIYDYLPRETRGYLPAFIAANYAYAYNKEHNITKMKQPLPLTTDTIQINRILHLGQVAEVLELPLDLLKKLNPQYIRNIIPATTKSYSLRLPQQYINQYIEYEEQIHKLDSTYLKQYIDPRNIDKLRQIPHNKIHVVKSGDTLSGIAQKYRVSTRQLMSWNKLRSAHKLSIGQKLIVSN